MTDTQRRAEQLAELRVLAHARELADLFERRPDLAGVHPPADLAADAVRWSV